MLLYMQQHVCNVIFFKNTVTITAAYTPVVSRGFQIKSVVLEVDKVGWPYMEVSMALLQCMLP